MVPFALRRPPVAPAPPDRARGRGLGTLRRRVAAAACASLLLLVGLAHAQQDGIVVHGTGTVQADPDLARITVGVDVTDGDIQVALDRADATMTRVRQALFDAGVARADVQTVRYQVWREELRDRDGTVTGARYHVEHSYQVTVRALGDLGRTLADALDAGATSVGAITFGVADPAALQATARDRAVDDAHARAEQLARRAGVELGAPLAIEEAAAPTPVALQGTFARVDGAGAVAPVEAGSLTVRVDLTVRYAIP